MTQSSFPDKSGDILSAFIALAVSVSTLTSPSSSQVMYFLYQSGAMPEWAIVAAICSLICLITSIIDIPKAHALSKFISGCVWGSMVLLLGTEGQLFPLFWISLVLFAFDFLTVVLRSRSWRQRKVS